MTFNFLTLHIHDILRQYWGHASFRPLQEDIINSVLQKNDTLALLPTGGGKSICFKIPALLQTGICVVVSPLIALMNDQDDNLTQRGIKAQYLIAGMGKREIDIALDNCVYGDIKFLYISPERLSSDLVRERIKYMNVNLFAIDEAHCISEWGYDFRPSYLSLSSLRELHPQVPFLALTATATHHVRTDIQEKLNFRKDALVFQKSFERKNISYVVLNEENKYRRLLQILNKISGSSIVYVRNRKETVAVAQHLSQNGISADFYHAGLEASIRSDKQTRWKNNANRVMVCTNAFGMGIDKPDVRLVLHMTPPDTLEAYYQEAGRAGRDEKKAYAVLLYAHSDCLYLEDKIKKNYPSVAEIQFVYHQLGNYFQLAIGAGEGLSLAFDLIDFCSHYKLNTTKTIHALKFLERAVYITLSESVFLPSRAKIIVSNEVLYQFQLQYPHYDNFLKNLLRLNGGMFSQYVPIKEREIARSLSMDISEVVNYLKRLTIENILSYLPQTDKPYLTFVQARRDAKYIQLDYIYIKQRREQAIQKFDAVVKYVESRHCRSQILLQYFDDNHAERCGVCDICIAEKRQVKQKTIFAKIQHQSIDFLKEKPRSLQELLNLLTGATHQEKLYSVRAMLDAGEFVLDSSQNVLKLNKH